MRKVLVNRLGGLSLPRKSGVRLTDRPDMTLDVYRGRKTITQQQLYPCRLEMRTAYALAGPHICRLIYMHSLQMLRKNLIYGMFVNICWTYIF